MLELSVTSMRKCKSCTTNLNNPAPYAHMGLVTRGPSNTNESNDILEEKWQAVLNLDIWGRSFLGVYSLLLAGV